MVARVPFFAPSPAPADRPREFPALATRFFLTRVYTPDATIVYANESQREMFIVREGFACVFHNDALPPLQVLGIYCRRRDCVVVVTASRRV